MELLDYPECLSEFRFKDPATGHSPFFEDDGRCPFCGGQTTPAYSAGRLVYDPDDELRRDDVHHSVSVSTCRCGWWSFVHHETPDAAYEYATPAYAGHYRGVLRRYDAAVLGGLEAPVATLRRVLARAPSMIDALHPRKMEELVGSVFADFFPHCEAVHCGRSHDGGVDLILIVSDTLIAVQVKHRQRIDRGEPVSAVRDFLGAMLIQGMAHGVFVTTADHFSHDSRKAAHDVVERGAVSSFRLVDRGALFNLLQVTRSSVDPWRRYLPHSLRGERADG
ncbi:MAG TPA: restriction endonuclease [Longimicrobium sp.]|nr:restriction endonuclease [Longimicrobium sp.]